MFTQKEMIPAFTVSSDDSSLEGVALYKNSAMGAQTMAMRLSLVAGLIQFCHASFDANISSYINVQVPVHLHQHNISGGLIHRTAQFGKHFDLWQKEGHIAALTHYVQGPLCSVPDDNITKLFGQPPFFLIAGML